MAQTPVQLDTVTLVPSVVAPFTHVLTFVVGPWTHESRLELPGIELVVRAGRSPGTWVLACAARHGSCAEAFDRGIGNCAGAVGTLARWLRPYHPGAAHHLLQGVASALVYFGRQAGLVELDDEGTVRATARRRDG